MPRKKRIPLFFRVLILLLLMVGTTSHAIVLRKREQVPSSFSVLKSGISKIKKEALISNLHELMQCCRPDRLPGSEGHAKAAEWIVKKLKEMDADGNATVIVDAFDPDIEHAVNLFETDFQKEVASKFSPTSVDYLTWRSFTDQTIDVLRKFKGVRGKNIIWEKKGSIDPDSLIMITANYDTILQDKQSNTIKLDGRMPGADDNGSGIVVLLALAELLIELEIPKTVRIVFFDYQELGFLGSHAYLKKYGEELKKNKRFLGMINLLMLGNDTKNKDDEGAYGNMHAYIRRPTQKGYGLDLKLSQQIMERGQGTSSNIEFELRKSGFDTSDHLNFWEAGLPAMVLTQNWESDLNPRHHTSDDFVETLNPRTLWESYRYVAGSVAGWAFDLVR